MDTPLALQADALRERQACIRAQLRQLTREDSQAARRAWAEQRSLRDVAFVLVVHCGPSLAEAARFLELHAERGSVARAPGWQQTLQERYLQAEPEQLLEILAGSGGGLPAAVHRRAARFLRELQLERWVRSQNEIQGVAPSSRMVARVRASMRPTGEAMGREGPAARGRAASLKWVQRFRKRWRMRLGAPEPRDKVPLEILRAKVALTVGHS